MHTVSKDDIEAFSIDELSEHLIVDKLFPASEIESLEGKPERIFCIHMTLCAYISNY